MKLVKDLIILFMIANEIEKNQSTIQNKHWLVSCLSCSSHFNFCFNCYGIPQCTECLTSIRPECSYCINDIYQDDKLEIIDGKKYLICDKSRGFHSKACHLFCRGMYYVTGTCQRFKNKPVCRCKNSNNNSNKTLAQTTTKLAINSSTKAIPTTSVSSTTLKTKAKPTTSVSSTTLRTKAIPTTSVSSTTPSFPVTTSLKSYSKDIKQMIKVKIFINEFLVDRSLAPRRS
ncbi:hypothetical protein BpHYR1_018628 [Brachionus plicatilis]|uniref:Uncharacterized protein n=1 Tax=Brachionus plicatilis TaxID=10195 RepID=A0A3M7RUM8_BRAPC|nr:hypothetical protein BpHYR1_018628 [Brachionus plicatilis]